MTKVGRASCFLDSVVETLWPVDRVAQWMIIEKERVWAPRRNHQGNEESELLKEATCTTWVALVF
ncbi:hypothetical protein M413DRAFT_437785 [Hebeloma cylindrosporum]|uniref:Uncharacterized protein n=1 Tax=Hebeloma cylindrosporum TaxID=76867 RepID=A0A0C3CWQ5_HEBCY|nr:hypothetical protein M413DRAFT_437785 [Hebeloma cylindrosporum h7]